MLYIPSAARLADDDIKITFNGKLLHGAENVTCKFIIYVTVIQLLDEM